MPASATLPTVAAGQASLRGAAPRPAGAHAWSPAPRPVVRRALGGRTLLQGAGRVLPGARDRGALRVAGAAVTEEAVTDTAEFKNPLKKCLCANRGEIAIRVFRAAAESDIQSVAVYSPADRLMPHRYKADESYQVGEPSMQPVACYLDIENIIQVAKENGVDCIHPGYGFLSENATFARRCREEGITFIGPPAEVIDNMGDKTAARKLAISAGVSVVPGVNVPLNGVEEAIDFAKEAGYPVMLKAAMGGGGRGMRVVKSEEEIDEAYTRCKNEAKAAFGDDRMFIEKFVEEPRHIEVQIIADSYGNVTHLYERDCSVQRRHQKVVEVAPSAGLTEETRQNLFNDALKIAHATNYVNAGTVEFMVDKYGAHYFLEVNPRVQVEHTITEEVTGVDIVQTQMAIAGGASLKDLGLDGELPPPQGFAIQCRVTCEDPSQNFQPDTGRLENYRIPGGPGIRIDSAVTTGNVVSPHYDSLLSKVISSGSDFKQARTRMARALKEFSVRGVHTNIPFMINVMEHEEFTTGTATTSFIERHSDQLFQFSDVRTDTTKLLDYLANQVVNGAQHAGATGPYPTKASPLAPKMLRPDEPLTGWRDVYVKDGAAGWAKAVRAHKGLLLTDTTWRDAHQSLLATRMRTHDMLKAAPATSQVLANAGSLEMWGGATFDVSMRFLNECPWARLEQLREAVPNIPFQMLLRGANGVGYSAYPDNVVRQFAREAVLCGNDIFRVFDSLNYVDNLKFGMDAVDAAGGIVEGTICYTGDVSDPKRTRYDLEYYLNLAEQLVDHGVHALGIKDMAGLMKPRAATILVTALRERFPDTVIHVHTHDCAGTGVATQLAAAAAGADIVDCALDALSGTTSQPSMGAIINSLRDSDLDTGICPDEVADLSVFWEKSRDTYCQFESTLKSTSSDVYFHEMPGGQYTNLKFQATSLGLGDSWDKVKSSYAAANRALGDIVKVTPSSKVVGDLAQFMVQNDLDEESLVQQAENLSLPSSVVEYLQGYLGQPPYGFPEPLRTRVTKGKGLIEERPGATMSSLNLAELQSRLREKYGAGITDRDVLSAALYPQVFEEFKAKQLKYSSAMEKLPTKAFFAPLEVDEEIEVELSKGKRTVIKYKATGELQPNGVREVFFEVDGIPRVIDEIDTSDAGASRAAREKADPFEDGSVGAPMAGDIVEVSVKPGQKVDAGDQLLVMSAMKMETSVCAPCGGTISHVAAIAGENLDAGDLVVLIQEEA